jgi:hypothetical protein
MPTDVASAAISVRLKFCTLGTVGLIELLMFGSWCDPAVFRGMMCLLDIRTYRNMFQMRDTEQKVQAAYSVSQNGVG